MSNAIIELPDGTRATYDGDKWTCDNKTVETALNLDHTEAQLYRENPLAYFPNPVAETAIRAAELYHAQVIELPETEYEDGAIY